MSSEKVTLESLDCVTAFPAYDRQASLLRI